MDSLTELFCLIDDFCQDFEPEWEKRLLADGIGTGDGPKGRSPATPPGMRVRTGRFE